MWVMKKEISQCEIWLNDDILYPKVKDPLQFDIAMFCAHLFLLLEDSGVHYYYLPLLHIPV